MDNKLFILHEGCCHFRHSILLFNRLSYRTLKRYVKMTAKENKTTISNIFLLTLVEFSHFLSRKNQQTTSNNKEYNI